MANQLQPNARSEGLYGPTAMSGQWAWRETARTPVRFRDRVIAQFRSPENVAYLQKLFTARVPAGPLRSFTLDTFHDALLAFSEGEGRALEMLGSDPLAQRGDLRPALGLWGEIKRLNRAFYEDRLAFLREYAHTIDGSAPRDGIDDDGEQYHMRMFISDSLRPPGLEHLNTPGPLYAIREDQSTWEPQGGHSRRKEGFTGGSHGAAGGTHGAAGGTQEADVFLYGDHDAPWSKGDPNRTAEQALAEYWGDNQASSDTMTGASETMGQTYGDATAWGDQWQQNGGTRFMRYPEVPFWQKGGREGYDRDIDETLGTAGRELDNHVRRWDMDRVRKPRGQEYRHYGPRSGHVV